MHNFFVGLWFTFAWVNKIATTRSKVDDLSEGDDVSEAINIQLKQF